MTIAMIKKPHPNKKDRTRSGMKFGKLTLLRKARKPKSKTGASTTTFNSSEYSTYWRALCDCGKIVVLNEQYLFRTNNPKRHCGCDNRSLASIYKEEYGIWYMMNRRCQEPTHVSYNYYGRLGVSVHPDWDCRIHGQKGFERFFAYIGKRPSPQHTLDRINPFGNYVPKNVRWATSEEQGRNKREHWVKQWHGIRQAKLKLNSKTEEK